MAAVSASDRRRTAELTFLPLPGRKFRFDLREVPD
jgi:hypothetical protein